MGLISAGDEHNRRGDEALAGLDQVEKVVDVFIYDADFESPRKFVFAEPEVSYCARLFEVAN